MGTYEPDIVSFQDEKFFFFLIFSLYFRQKKRNLLILQPVPRLFRQTSMRRRPKKSINICFQAQKWRDSQTPREGLGESTQEWRSPCGSGNTDNAYPGKHEILIMSRICVLVVCNLRGLMDQLCPYNTIQFNVEIISNYQDSLRSPYKTSSVHEFQLVLGWGERHLFCQKFPVTSQKVVNGHQKAEKLHKTPC